MATYKIFLRRCSSFLLAVLLMLTLTLPGAAFAVEAVDDSLQKIRSATAFFVGTQTALQSALHTADAHITLTADFDISGTFVPAGTFATIDGNGFISTVASGNGILVGAGAGLRLENVTMQGTGGLTGLVLQHGTSWPTVQPGAVATIADGTSISGFIRRGVQVGNGTLTMTGGTISGNSSTTPGGGVSVTGGTFFMSGGAISGNTGLGITPGGGVAVQNGATFVMSGGEISGNTTAWNGGGVFVNNAFGFLGIPSTFTMTGGAIRDNTAAIFGGGVRVDAGGAFILEGGAISGNTANGSNPAQGGGGVSVYTATGTFSMSGGAISGNTAQQGGGVAVNNASTFSMTGGTISGNTAHRDGGGVGIYWTGVFSMTGGTISGNTAAYNGGGIFAGDYANLTTSAAAIFNGNTASSAHDFFLSPSYPGPVPAPESGGGLGGVVVPNIRWASVSIPGTHALNNFDINYTGHPIQFVTFNPNGGTFISADQLPARVVSIDGTYAQAFDAAGNLLNLPLPHPTRSGFVFGGWFNSQAEADNYPSSIGLVDYYHYVSSAPNRTLWARWVEALGPLTLTFVLNGGNVNGVTADIVYNDLPPGTVIGTRVPAPTRPSHTFTGWRYPGQDPGTPNLTSVYVATLQVYFGGRVTFIAQWTPTGNGGTPPPTHERQAYLIGFRDGSVRPNGNITRAEVATIFFRLITDGARADYWTQTNPFPDVELQNWFNNAVSTMTNANVFRGFPDGTFAPNQTITRAEMAAVIVRFMEEMDGVHLLANHFDDIYDHWAMAYINTAAVNGWVRGYPDGTFRPDAPITRAEAAAMVNRIQGRLQERTEDLLLDMLTWPDNARENAWYYFYIQSATNSYTFQWRGLFENWITIIEPREWWRLERPDSTPQSIFE